MNADLDAPGRPDFGENCRPEENLPCSSRVRHNLARSLGRQFGSRCIF